MSNAAKHAKAWTPNAWQFQNENCWVSTSGVVNTANQTVAFNNVTNFGQFLVAHRLMVAVVTNLPGVREETAGPLAAGNFDNDGDLDLAISKTSTRIYRNDGNGVFTDIGISLPYVRGGNLVWGDYDNDGRLDLAIMNDNNTYIYRNDGGGAFSLAATLGMVGSIYGGFLAWGDYNNDGRPDLFAHSATDVSRIYRNDGGAVFTDIGAGLDGQGYQTAVWGDYNNDGRLDLALIGWSVSRMYRNNGDDTFTDIGAVLPNGPRSRVAWGDYDNDGDLDLAYIGDNGTRIYRNDGNGVFTNIQAGLPTIQNFDSIVWGDYDNDGDLDLTICSGTLSGGDNIARVYRNDGNGAFTDTGLNLSAVSPDSTVHAIQGDFDNDGWLDVMIGQDNKTVLWRNNYSATNTPPAAPTGLGATAASATEVALRWSPATDSQTPAKGLSYNLRVGTAPGAGDVFSGEADLGTGWRRLPALGNVNQNTNWTFRIASGGAYYWSVQAVDGAWAGGAWAAEQVFTNPLPVVTTAPISNVTPSSAQGGGEATFAGTSPITANGLVWDTNANPTVTVYLGKSDHGGGLGSFSDTMSGLSPGVTYYVRAYAVNAAGAGYGLQRVFVPPMTPPGNALDFDGSNDYVGVSDANSLDLTTDYTLEVWFKPDSFGGLRGLISKYHLVGANGYLLRLTGTDLDFDQLTTSGLNLQAGRWYHVAAVKSGGTRTLYLNGTVQTLSGTALSVQTNASELRLGSDYGGRYFDGQMDEARLWNIVRSETDIRDAMHRQLAGSESGLAAYYQFNHLSGTALDDLTANNNDGALVNGPVWLASTIPCADLIAGRANLRGAWIARTNSLASSILSVSNAVVSGADFRVFGHDNGTLAQNTSDKPARLIWRLNRAWRMEGTGTLTGDLAFDCSGIAGLITDTSKLRLLTDADGVFANANVTFNIVASGLAADGNSQMTFAGIPGQTYLVQRTLSLTTPVVWTSLTNNVSGTISFVAGPTGQWTHTDLNSTNYPTRFYRSAVP